MPHQPMTRAQFLTRAVAAVAGATMPMAAARGARGAALARRLTYRGVGYEVADGATLDAAWNAARMRADPGRDRRRSARQLGVVVRRRRRAPHPDDGGGRRAGPARAAAAAPGR